MNMHKSITPQRIMEACERHQRSLDNPGFCITCGAEAEGVEPDAEKYICEACGALVVYGAEQIATFCHEDLQSPSNRDGSPRTADPARPGNQRHRPQPEGTHPAPS